MVKKVTETWKTKVWYSVIAPGFLNNIEVASIVGIDDEQMINRVIMIPLKNITRDFAHIYTNIRLRVSEVKDRKAFTKFIGHEVSREYIQSLVRKRRDVLNIVLPARSADGVDFSVKAIVITAVRCSERQKHELRRAFTAELKRIIESKNFGEFILDVLHGRMLRELHDKLNKIFPIKRVEIRKTQLKEDFDTVLEQKEEKTGEEAAVAPEAKASE